MNTGQRNVLMVGAFLIIAVILLTSAGTSLSVFITQPYSNPITINRGDTIHFVLYCYYESSGYPLVTVMEWVLYGPDQMMIGSDHLVNTDLNGMVTLDVTMDQPPGNYFIEFSAYEPTGEGGHDLGTVGRQDIIVRGTITTSTTSSTTSTTTTPTTTTTTTTTSHTTTITSTVTTRTTTTVTSTTTVHEDGGGYFMGLPYEFFIPLTLLLLIGISFTYLMISKRR